MVSCLNFVSMLLASWACARVAKVLPATAFIPSHPSSTCTSRRVPSSVHMSGGTILRPNSGGYEVAIEKDSTVELDGCKVEEKGGRYFCKSENGLTKIGANALTTGVSYGLNDGMTITTDDGTEYELKIEGGGLPTERKDPTMGLVFDAMKAQFGVTDD